MNVFSRSVLVAGILATASCRDATAPSPDQAVAVGSYFLTSEVDRGPASGQLMLLPDGRAERIVRYRQADGSLSANYVSVGTFRVTGPGTVEFGLRENGGLSQYEWKVSATLNNGTLTFSYPHPADGFVVEIYKLL